MTDTGKPSPDLQAELHLLPAIITATSTAHVRDEPNLPVYAGYTSRRVRSARHPLTITQQASANVKDRNQGLPPENPPSMKKPEYLQQQQQ